MQNRHMGHRDAASLEAALRKRYVKGSGGPSQLRAGKPPPSISVVEAEAKFAVDLAWVVVMESSERHTVVQEDSAIPHIQSGHGNAVFLGEAFSQ